MATSLPKPSQSSLQDLIPLVNTLQDLTYNTLGTETLDLPQVVVVGSQSSGKSSVLENLVGRDFLPRGSGIVTRRPLVLQLINIGSPSEDPQDAALEPEWAEFLHSPGHRFTDFDAVRREIEAETARVAGLNKGINRLPIHLKIFSPNVLNLTLVDLPGLTKIPIGDQPPDIERQIRSLVVEYIAKPNSIILAVTPANIDLVNSEGLKLARQVDPMGKRTIGVLTKLDLMDHGTNALEILAGRVYPLKLGFIGTVNRSQQDITVNKSLKEALKAEEAFFRQTPAYRNIAHRCGTQYLAKSLNTILMQHIREKLPDIKAKLNTLMGQTQQELASYGEPQFSAPQHRGSLILQLMTRFATSFVASIDGTSSEISTKELCGGARIYYIFNSVFGQSLDSIEPTQNLTVHDIRTAIRNSTGPRPSLFVPEMAFDLLVKPQIRLLESPSLRCVELVYEELMKICHTCGSQEINRFPRLQTKLIEVVSELLRERLGPTSRYVESLIAIQGAYINTNHPNFLGATGAMNSMMNNQNTNANKPKRREASAIRTRERSALGERVNGMSPKLEAPTDTVNGASPNTAGVPSEHPTTPTVAQHLHHHHRTDSHSTENGLVANAASNARETFLNYFFGNSKDGTMENSVVMPRQTESRPSEEKRHRRVRENSRPVDMSSFVKEFEEMNFAMEDINDEPPLTDRERIETDLIRSLISSYFLIVRESIQDLIPKAIMHLLVNHCKDVLQTRLVADLYREDKFNELLYEDENLKQEREKCEKMLSVYKEATRVIAEVM